MKPYFQEEWFHPSFPIKMRILQMFFLSFLWIYKTIRKNPTKIGCLLIASRTEDYLLVCIEALKSHQSYLFPSNIKRLCHNSIVSLQQITCCMKWGNKINQEKASPMLIWFKMHFFNQTAPQNIFVLPYLGFYLSLKLPECDFLYISIIQMWLTLGKIIFLLLISPFILQLSHAVTFCLFLFFFFC